MRRSRVTCCLASSTQQMNSLRPSGVMSCHNASAAGFAISAARKSAGTLCTTPPATFALLMAWQRPAPDRLARIQAVEARSASGTREATVAPTAPAPHTGPGSCPGSRTRVHSWRCIPAAVEAPARHWQDARRHPRVCRADRHGLDARDRGWCPAALLSPSHRSGS